MKGESQILRGLSSALVLAAGLACAAAADTNSAPANRLKQVRSFMYQLQGMDDAASVERLAKSPYDLLIVDPTFNVKGREQFDAKALVSTLKAGKPGRLVVAYADIGEAEQFRSYWEASWKAPASKASTGSPSFLLGPDPDGWEEDVSIAFWDARWKALWLGTNGLIERIMRAGFDGIYLDQVEAYEDDGVAAAARKQGLRSGRAMVDFIVELRKQARLINPGALVIAQNAPGLIDEDMRYAGLIDGAAFEDTWFSGEPNAEWDDPEGGDIPNHDIGDGSTSAQLKQYQKYLKAHIPVFTIDYCLKPENAARVYDAAAKAGLVPLVTRVSLERLTTTPPPGHQLPGAGSH